MLEETADSLLSHRNPVYLPFVRGIIQTKHPDMTYTQKSAEELKANVAEKKAEVSQLRAALARAQSEQAYLEAALRAAKRPELGSRKTVERWAILPKLVEGRWLWLCRYYDTYEWAATKLRRQAAEDDFGRSRTEWEDVTKWTLVERTVHPF